MEDTYKIEIISPEKMIFSDENLSKMNFVWQNFLKTSTNREEAINRFSEKFSFEP